MLGIGGGDMNQVCTECQHSTVDWEGRGPNCRAFRYNEALSAISGKMINPNYQSCQEARPNDGKGFARDCPKYERRKGLRLGWVIVLVGVAVAYAVTGILVGMAIVEAML